MTRKCKWVWYIQCKLIKLLLSVLSKLFHAITVFDTYESLNCFFPCFFHLCYHFSLVLPLSLIPPLILLSFNLVFFFLSLSYLTLQNSCHKLMNPCCPLRDLLRTSTVPARVEAAQLLPSKNLVSSWESCVWIKTI